MGIIRRIPFTRLEISRTGQGRHERPLRQGPHGEGQAAGHQPREVFLTTSPAGHPDKGATIAMFDKGKRRLRAVGRQYPERTAGRGPHKRPDEPLQTGRLGVVLTPQLERAFVQITPPAYTGLKGEEKPFLFKGVQALEGSDVRFRLQSNRPLRDGRLDVTCGDGPLSRCP